MLQLQPTGLRQRDSDLWLAGPLGERNHNTPSAPQLSEPPTALQPELDTWEQVLCQWFLQAAAAPARGPAGGCWGSCRWFRRAAGLAPSGDAEYKAFSSLLTSDAWG